MKKTLTIFALLAAVATAGCNATMANRVACTVGKDKAFVVSEYGPVGVSAVIDDKDAAVICK